MEDNAEKIPKKESRRNLRIIYILATVIVIALIALIDPNFKDIFTVMPTLNFKWIIGAIVLLLIFWLTEGILLQQITSYVHDKKVKFRSSIKVGIIGLYYGALTPFATGGQPLQVIYMKRNDIPVGTGTCIVCLKFIMYELALCTMAIVGLSIFGSELYAATVELFWFTILGVFINFASLVFVFLTLIHKTFATKLVIGIVKFLAKIRIIKKTESKIESIKKTMDDYVDAAQYIKNNLLKVAVTYLLTIVDLILLFSIPYMIYLAFGHSEAPITTFVATETFHYLAIAFFPMPGAAGASEGGFYLFFYSLFTKVPVFLPMIIWRFLTYYLILFVGSLLVVFDELLIMRKMKKQGEIDNSIGNKKT